MITKEILKTNVSDLTEEQASKIETVVNNALGQRIGEIHGQYDADIFTATGRQKPAGVKTYEHLKTILTELKSGANGDEFKSQIETLKAEKQTLADQMKSGESAQLAAKDDMIAQLKTGFATEKSEWEKQLSERDQSTLKSKSDNEFNLAFTGLKKKDYSTISETLQKAAFAQAVRGIESEYKQQVENGVLIFKDKDGKTKLNKAFEPATAAELLSERKEVQDLLSTGVQGAGAGTGATGTNDKVTVSIGAAKTKTEATEAIRAGLFAEGLTVESPAFQSRFTEAYKTNEVSKLPTR